MPSVSKVITMCVVPEKKSESSMIIAEADRLLKDKATTTIRNVKAPFFIDLSPQRVVCCEHKFCRILYSKLILTCKCGLFKKKISVKLFFCRNSKLSAAHYFNTIHEKNSVQDVSAIFI